jgi:hypothetical protein
MHARIAVDDAMHDALVRLTAVRTEAEKSVDRFLLHAFIAGSGVAVVASIAWFVARTLAR